jgi:hypothetical protein
VPTLSPADVQRKCHAPDECRLRLNGAARASAQSLLLARERWHEPGAVRACV